MKKLTIAQMQKINGGARLINTCSGVELGTSGGPLDKSKGDTTTPTATVGSFAYAYDNGTTICTTGNVISVGGCGGGGGLMSQLTTICLEEFGARIGAYK